MADPVAPRAKGGRLTDEGPLSDNAASPRQDTKLEAEGAEFLLLGMLLIEGITCYKAYTNTAGYDLVAVDPYRARSARIQVKSRWATDYDRSFPIRNFNCEFVVLAALNRGYRFRRNRAGAEVEDGRGGPRLYCFPVDAVRAAQRPDQQLGQGVARAHPRCGELCRGVALSEAPFGKLSGAARGSKREVGPSRGWGDRDGS